MGDGTLSLVILVILGMIAMSIMMVIDVLKATKPKERQPICGCSHHFSFHDSDGCHKLDGFRECGCKSYIHQDNTTADLEQELDI